jgi:hypothetical protein
MTEAAEVLGDAERKQLYDQSYGLGNFKRFIPSKTTTLTWNNYERLVKKSMEFWVIQVFEHDSGLSNSFADDWERLAKKYPYLKFGRIDFKSQQKLIPSLPFKPLEFPFIFFEQRDINPEFVEYRAGANIARGNES